MCMFELIFLIIEYRNWGIIHVRWEQLVTGSISKYLITSRTEHVYYGCDSLLFWQAIHSHIGQLMEILTM